MNKFTLTIILILLGQIGFSQITYFNYLDYTSEWRNYGGGWNGLNAYDVYETRYFDGYAVINGVTYYQEYFKSVETNYNPPFGTTNSVNHLYGPYYFREDSSGKFYRINPNNGNEDVIFDNQEIANSQVGQPFPYPGAVCNVETIELINLGTMVLKKVKGLNLGNRTGTLEGVGVLGLACATSFESDGGINCYSKNGNSLQFGTINCNLFPFPNRVNLSISTKLNYLIAKNINIYPNPTTGILKIKSFNNLVNEKFKITDIRGSIINEGILNGTDKEVDLTNYSNGIYILNVFGENLNEFIKIIKK